MAGARAVPLTPETEAEPSVWEGAWLEFGTAILTGFERLVDLPAGVEAEVDAGMAAFEAECFGLGALGILVVDSGKVVGSERICFDFEWWPQSEYFFIVERQSHTETVFP